MPVAGLGGDEVALGVVVVGHEVGDSGPEEAGDGGHKCAHIIALDNGNFAAQPNNRVQWFCPAFVTPFQEKPDYVTNTRVWKVERETETRDGFFYDTPSMTGPAQVALYAKGLRVGTPKKNGAKVEK